MADPGRESAPAVGDGRGAGNTDLAGLRRDHTTRLSVAPVDALLARLEHVRKSGKGWTARCPAHEDRTASLSIGEGAEGRILLHCFAGCGALDVVHAVGLELADLFPQRLADQTREGRAAMREAARMANWSAALGVVAREATIVSIVAHQVSRHEAINPDDLARLILATQRIDDAREVLCGR